MSCFPDLVTALAVRPLGLPESRLMRPSSNCVLSLSPRSRRGRRAARSSQSPSLQCTPAMNGRRTGPPTRSCPYAPSPPPSPPPPPGFTCGWEALVLYQSQGPRGTTGLVIDHRIKPACFLFFSKGSARETKGNFCP